MTWIYLSPHFDDVALSCGGLAWEQTSNGETVSIWTICAGQPPQGELSPFAETLHTRWSAGKNGLLDRMVEDIHACQRLGANYHHFSYLDCIYRRNPETGEFMYASEQALNGPLHPGDGQVARELQEEFRKLLPAGVTVVCPLALGNHVDHQLTRLVAEGLALDCMYYADFPYVRRAMAQLQQLGREGWRSRIYPITAGGLVAWQDSICAHGSQISTFWPDEAEMRRDIRQYLLENGGIRLWKRPTS